MPIKDIVFYVLTFFSGITLGYLGHLYQITQGKIGIQRERLMRNIALVEQFLAKEIELEYICFEQNEEGKKINMFEKELEIIKADLNETGKVLDINIAKQKQSLDEERKMLVDFKERLHVLQKDFSLSDISSICNLIDPSNQLSKFVGELGNVVKNIADNKDVVVNKEESLQLRHKIRNFLDKRIK